jgi:hypothetical protein
MSFLFFVFSHSSLQQHISHTQISLPNINILEQEQEICVNFCCGRGAGAAQGGDICGSASAQQRSGQRHSGTAAVAAAATATAAAVDSRQRCSTSGAGAAPSGLGFTLAAQGASSGGGICGGASAHQHNGQKHRGAAAVLAAATATAAAAAVAQWAAVQPQRHKGGPLWLRLCHRGLGDKQCWRHLRRHISAAASGVGAQRQWQ